MTLLQQKFPDSHGICISNNSRCVGTVHTEFSPTVGSARHQLPCYSRCSKNNVVRHGGACPPRIEEAETGGLMDLKLAWASETLPQNKTSLTRVISLKRA